ncbi:ATP-dependent DNA ligase [Actinokineospora sp. NBRC 105648]|uniref:ATP-dependent DNA ligase n=1 Tax=Actinokineospora sp. NBRC 105648 TaxID=3032206 RepID=UPI0024A103BE|nr:ATP-dependent DNA ligase [Actinokineospora sp. NBRC 105648]GLZ38971.1 ATP-dependent DNA ligase [Actinokineospora sp. NBRC 105648]
MWSVALPLTPPVQPMLAKPAKSIPDGSGLVFEPKWDGFRCLVFRDGTEVTLQSRSGKPLNRYFPEAAAALLDALPDRVVVDGELVVDLDGRLDFDALSERIHPAASRVNMLAEKTPSRFITFDLLALGDDLLLDTPGVDRRRRLEDVLTTTDSVHLTPATTDADLARQWFTIFEGAGLDGVMGKPADGPYTPNKRTMLKFKHSRTADCVVAGLRWHKDSVPGEAIGSLMLGLYDHTGSLNHVGVVGSFTVARRRELAEELAELMVNGADEHPWASKEHDIARMPGSISRWRTTEQPWVPLRLERVVEVAYEHTEGGYPSRFRHTAQFQRWRPDREPTSCTYEQLEEPARYDLDSVLRGEVKAR